jgi:hypothetical protein
MTSEQNTIQINVGWCGGNPRKMIVQKEAKCRGYCRTVWRGVRGGKAVIRKICDKTNERLKSGKMWERTRDKEQYGSE